MLLYAVSCALVFNLSSLLCLKQHCEPFPFFQAFYGGKCHFSIVKFCFLLLNRYLVNRCILCSLSIVRFIIKQPYL